MSKTEDSPSNSSAKIIINESSKNENDNQTDVSPEDISEEVSENVIENDAKAIVNKENVTNGDLHSEKSGKEDKDSREFVLISVDLNIKNDEGNEKEGEDKSTNQNEKSNVLEDDDNAVDMDVKEVQQTVNPKDEVENDPNFAVICSFLQQFGEALEIRFSIKQLKLMFEDYSKGRKRFSCSNVRIFDFDFY